MTVATTRSDAGGIPGESAVAGTLVNRTSVTVAEESLRTGVTDTPRSSHTTSVNAVAPPSTGMPHYVPIQPHPFNPTKPLKRKCKTSEPASSTSSAGSSRFVPIRPNRNPAQLPLPFLLPSRPSMLIANSPPPKSAPLVALVPNSLAFDVENSESEQPTSKKIPATTPVLPLSSTYALHITPTHSPAPVPAPASINSTELAQTLTNTLSPALVQPSPTSAPSKEAKQVPRPSLFTMKAIFPAIGTASTSSTSENTAPTLSSTRSTNKVFTSTSHLLPIRPRPPQQNEIPMFSSSSLSVPLHQLYPSGASTSSKTVPIHAHFSSIPFLGTTTAATSSLSFKVPIGPSPSTSSAVMKSKPKRKIPHESPDERRTRLNEEAKKKRQRRKMMSEDKREALRKADRERKRELRKLRRQVSENINRTQDVEAGVVLECGSGKSVESGGKAADKKKTKSRGEHVGKMCARPRQKRKPTTSKSTVKVAHNQGSRQSLTDTIRETKMFGQGANMCVQVGSCDIQDIAYDMLHNAEMHDGAVGTYYEQVQPSTTLMQVKEFLDDDVQGRVCLNAYPFLPGKPGIPSSPPQPPPTTPAAELVGMLPPPPSIMPDLLMMDGGVHEAGNGSTLNMQIFSVIPLCNL